MRRLPKSNIDLCLRALSNGCCLKIKLPSNENTYRKYQIKAQNVGETK